MHQFISIFKGLHQEEKKADYVILQPQQTYLLVIVKNVDEIRRLTPQLTLDVKAIALPLIPPGNISLNTNHDTEIKKQNQLASQVSHCSTLILYFIVPLNSGLSTIAEVLEAAEGRDPQIIKLERLF